MKREEYSFLLLFLTNRGTFRLVCHRKQTRKRRSLRLLTPSPAGYANNVCIIKFDFSPLGGVGGGLCVSFEEASWLFA